MQESTAKTAAEWVFVARSVAQLPGSQDHALRCMARAGLTAQDLVDWLAVAKAWAQDFNDSEMARQCLEKAESIAEGSDDSDDWIRLARIWKEDFQDSDNVTRCLEVIEADAEDTDDWIRIAKIWKENFQDTENAIRCMTEAEELAESFEDYSAIEETWRVDFRDVDRDIVNSAIQRLVDAGDNEGYFDGFRAWLAAQHESDSESDESPSAPVRPTAPITGAWDSDCVSMRRPGCYAKYYRFTLREAAQVTIDLSSSIDTYLYLIDGDEPTGTVLDENDDRDDGAEGLGEYDSRIRHSLGPGTYIVEATTFHEEEAGEFTLNIYYSPT